MTPADIGALVALDADTAIGLAAGIAWATGAVLLSHAVTR